MVIHKKESLTKKFREDIQADIVDLSKEICRNKKLCKYSHYEAVMNMRTYRWNYEYYCPVALTYHFKLNKW